MLTWTNALWAAMSLGGFFLLLLLALTYTPGNEHRTRAALLSVLLGVVLIAWGTTKLMSDFERRHPPDKTRIGSTATATRSPVFIPNQNYTKLAIVSLV